MTGVEWLWKALLDSGFEDIEDVEGFYYQAIKMEKQQIIDAYETNIDLNTIQTGEEYYNETYKPSV